MTIEQHIYNNLEIKQPINNLFIFNGTNRIIKYNCLSFEIEINGRNYSKTEIIYSEPEKCLFQV